MNAAKVAKATTVCNPTRKCGVSDQKKITKSRDNGDTKNAKVKTEG